MGLSEFTYSNENCKFFVLSSDTGALKLSPILIHKTIVSFAGEPKNIKKLNNGSLLIEVNNSKQAENLSKLQKIADTNIKVTPHRSLNQSRGVISETELQRELDEDLLGALKNQKVISVRRISIKKTAKISQQNT